MTADAESVDSDVAWDDWSDNGDVGTDCEDELLHFQSLFCAKIFTSVEECLSYDISHYKFDLVAYLHKYGLDEFGAFQCINFIRSMIFDGTDPLPQLEQGPTVFSHDKYLKPFLANDGLLGHDFTDSNAIINEGEAAELSMAQAEGTDGATDMRMRIACASAAARWWQGAPCSWPPATPPEKSVSALEPSWERSFPRLSSPRTTSAASRGSHRRSNIQPVSAHPLPELTATLGRYEKHFSALKTAP